MNTKKELAQSVQPFTCDAVTKGKRDSFIYIPIYRLRRECKVFGNRKGPYPSVVFFLVARHV